MPNFVLKIAYVTLFRTNQEQPSEMTANKFTQANPEPNALEPYTCRIVS